MALTVCCCCSLSMKGNEEIEKMHKSLRTIAQFNEQV